MGSMQEYDLVVIGSGPGGQKAAIAAAGGSLEELPAAVEVALYRVLDEALNNAVRHGRPSTVAVELTRSEGWIELTVADDGTGLPAPTDEGVGLTSMRERCEELGGRFEIRATRPGTEVRVAFDPELPPVPTTPIPVVFEDAWLLAVDKPAGLATQGTWATDRHDLLALLKTQRPDLNLFLHHRLDQGPQRHGAHERAGAVAHLDDVEGGGERFWRTRAEQRSVTKQRKTAQPGRLRAQAKFLAG